MPHRIRSEALGDLIGLYDEGAARFGIEQAERYTAGLRDVFAVIADHPLAQRLRREFTPPLRALRYRSHMIFYDVEEDASVTILRIRHGREDWLSDPLAG